MEETQELCLDSMLLVDLGRLQEVQSYCNTCLRFHNVCQIYHLLFPILCVTLTPHLLPQQRLFCDQGDACL